MKIPKAKKLPSGRWNIYMMVAGERISITAHTKKEAEAGNLTAKNLLSIADALGVDARDLI